MVPTYAQVGVGLDRLSLLLNQVLCRGDKDNLKETETTHVRSHLCLSVFGAEL